MRTFTYVERKYIHLLNSSDTGRRITEIFDNVLTRSNLEIDRAARTATFQFETGAPSGTSQQTNETIQKFRQLQYELVVLVKLIKYLVDNGLLTPYLPDPPLGNQIRFGQGTSVATTMNFPDTQVVDLLLSQIDSRFIPSPELRELENNKFIPLDERRFRKVQRLSWVAIIISLILGVWGVLHQTFGRSNDMFRQEVKTEMKSMKDSVSAGLNRIGDRIAAKDTQRVIILPKELRRLNRHCN